MASRVDFVTGAIKDFMGVDERQIADALLETAHAEMVKNMYESAEFFFNAAAKMGDSRGLYHLGLLYWAGLGVPKSSLKAVRMWRLAADRGSADAQNNLAVFFETGTHGHPKDEREAVRLYQRAAAQGHPQALFNLGRAVETGMGGLAKDEAGAMALYRAASV